MLPDHLQRWNGLLKGNWPADAGPIPDQNAVILAHKVLGTAELSSCPDLAIIMYSRPAGASNTEVRAATGDTWTNKARKLHLEGKLDFMKAKIPGEALRYFIGLPCSRPGPANADEFVHRSPKREKNTDEIDDNDVVQRKRIAMETITRPAALVRQGSLQLYATSLKVSDLKRPNFYTISKLDPADGGPGYQRLLHEGRAKRLADYLLDGQIEKDAFLPTSIFLATNKDIAFDSATNTITFNVNQIGPFNVVDGQHRIAGLVLAAERNPEMLEFEVPVNIAVSLDEISQMCHFLIVNTTQRSVDRAIEQQIVARLTKMIGLEKTPTMPRWIRRQVEKGEDARALAVANYLNDDPASPWCGKIRMANDEGDGATINQKSFITSLRHHVFSAKSLSGKFGFMARYLQQVA